MLKLILYCMTVLETSINVQLISEKYVNVFGAVASAGFVWILIP